MCFQFYFSLSDESLNTKSKLARSKNSGLSKSADVLLPYAETRSSAHKEKRSPDKLGGKHQQNTDHLPNRKRELLNARNREHLNASNKEILNSSAKPLMSDQLRSTVLVRHVSDQDDRTSQSPSPTGIGKGKKLLQISALAKLNKSSKQQTNSPQKQAKSTTGSSNSHPKTPRQSRKKGKYDQHSSKGFNSSHRGSKKLLQRKIKIISDEAGNCCANKPTKEKKVKTPSKAKKVLNGYANDHKYHSHVKILMPQMPKLPVIEKKEPEPAKLVDSGPVVQAMYDSPKSKVHMILPLEPRILQNQSPPKQNTRDVAPPGGTVTNQSSVTSPTPSMLSIVKKKQQQQQSNVANNRKSKSVPELSTPDAKLTNGITSPDLADSRKVQFAPGSNKMPHVNSKKLSSPINSVKRSNGFREGLDRNQLAVRKVSSNKNKSKEDLSSPESISSERHRSGSSSLHVPSASASASASSSPYHQYLTSQAPAARALLVQSLDFL